MKLKLEQISKEMNNKSVGVVAAVAEALVIDKQTGVPVAPWRNFKQVCVKTVEGEALLSSLDCVGVESLKLGDLVHIEHTWRVVRVNEAMETFKEGVEKAIENEP